MMKNIKIICLAFLVIVLGCGQSTSDSQEGDANPNNPGPITPTDRERYNLNTNDEMVYGTIDSVMNDSIRRDSIDNQKP